MCWLQSASSFVQGGVWAAGLQRQGLGAQVMQLLGGQVLQLPDRGSDSAQNQKLADWVSVFKAVHTAPGNAENEAGGEEGVSSRLLMLTDRPLGCKSGFGARIINLGVGAASEGGV